MSSICSKNDFNAIKSILEEKGIFDYFIFPSISWETKGMRLAQIIESIQLRAETVMFIDDNPNNRAEAAAIIPKLQIEDEKFIPAILTDARFKGKDDSKLTRLAQYKLLETRKRDEKQAEGKNEDFLRTCDVRVYIEYDLTSHADRIVELINRTNQLNYTKKRVPENLDEARVVLDLESWRAQGGLVRVMDKYGDYGYVGFFKTLTGRTTPQEGAADRRLEHFCFSCRTLGMLVEQWVYEALGRPELDVKGDVLTDLAVPRKIDWIRQVETLADPNSKRKLIAPEIRIIGGCEVNPVSVYLANRTEKVEAIGNYRSGYLFCRLNRINAALSLTSRSVTEFSGEAQALGLAPHLAASDFFEAAIPGTLFVLNFGHDAINNQGNFVHKTEGWQIWIEPLSVPELNLFSASRGEIEAIIKNKPHLRDGSQHLLTASAHLKAHYKIGASMEVSDHAERFREIFARIPRGCKVIVVANHFRMRTAAGDMVEPAFMRRYVELVAPVIKRHAYASIVSFSDVIETDDEVQAGGNHYDRVVYLRLADLIAKEAVSLVPKGYKANVDETLLAAE